MFPKHDGEKFLSQKKKSKKEKAQELFQEIMKCGAILDDEFKDLEQSNDQVIIIDMLGRMIWMNETFQDVNLKDLEVDIYESLLNDFGFEAYLELFEEVTKNNLDELKSNDIEFVRNYDNLIFRKSSKTIKGLLMDTWLPLNRLYKHQKRVHELRLLKNYCRELDCHLKSLNKSMERMKNQYT